MTLTIFAGQQSGLIIFICRNSRQVHFGPKLHNSSVRCMMKKEVVGLGQSPWSFPPFCSNKCFLSKSVISQGRDTPSVKTDIYKKRKKKLLLSSFGSSVCSRSVATSPLIRIPSPAAGRQWQRREIRCESLLIIQPVSFWLPDYYYYYYYYLLFLSSLLAVFADCRFSNAALSVQTNKILKKHKVCLTENYYYF